MCFLPGFYYHLVPHPEDTAEHKNKLMKMAQAEQEENSILTVTEDTKAEKAEEEDDSDNTNGVGNPWVCSSLV